MKNNFLSITSILSIIFLGMFELTAQHNVKRYYKNDLDFIVIDSTIVDFTVFSKDSVAAFERRAKNYEKTLDQKRDKYKLAAIYHYIIHTNLTLNKKQEALLYLYKLLEIPGLKDSKGAIDVYWGLFHLYRFMGNTPGMLEQFDDLKRLGIKYAYYKETEEYNLDKKYGEILITSGYMVEAKNFYLNKLVKDSLIFDPVRFAIINNDLASIYEELHQPDSVDIFRKRAFKALNSNRKDNYESGYRNYIRNYIKLQDLWYRNRFNKESLKFAKDFLEDAVSNQAGEVHTAVYANHFIANYHFTQRNYNNGLENINAAIAIAENKFNANQLNELFTLKSRILDALGKTEEAQETYHRFSFLRDSLNALNRDTYLARYEIEKVLEEQEKIKNLSIENETKYKSAFRVAITVLILCLISIITLILLAKNRKKVKEARDEVSLKLKERDLLLKELNHRVKNNLSLIVSLIKFQSQEINEQFYLEKFNHLENRISTIAIAHEQFIYSEDNIEGKFYNLQEYLSKISNSLVSLSTKNIVFNQKVENIDVNIDTALPIGILMNELISNSLEHAEFDKILKIDITITATNEWITILYSDSGKGFQLKENTTSLGLFIIESMVTQLQGSIDRKGTLYTIKLKKKLNFR